MRDRFSLVKRPPAELIIGRPDGTEDRFVRPFSQSNAATEAAAVAEEDLSEEYRIVADCAPYTASFNNILLFPRPDEDPQRMVSLVHQRMHRDQIPLNIQTYNLLMKRVVRFTDGMIFSLYDELITESSKENASVCPNIETFVLLFRACERGAQYNKAFLLYQQMREMFHLVPETNMYNTLLGYCAAVGDVAQAGYLVEEMKENHVERDVNTYNCLMSVMVECAPYEKTLAVFNELINQGIRPTIRSYNTVLKAACQQGDYDRAFQLAEEMKRKNLIPDVQTYNYLTTLCEQRLDYVDGTGAFAGERRTRQQLTEGRRSVAELVLTLLKDMRAMKVQPNTYTFNMALSTLIRCEDERVFTVYNDMVVCATAAMEKNQGKANAVSWDDGPDPPALHNQTGIFGGFLDVGAALEEAMQTEGSHEIGNMRGLLVRPNVETLKQMLRACLLFGYYPEAKDLFEDFGGLQVSVDRDLALMVLSICSATKNREWADGIMKQLKTKGVMRDTSIMNAYLRVLCEVAPEEVYTCFEQMQRGIHESGAWADTDTYNVVLAYSFSVPDKEDYAKKLYHMMSQPYSVAPPNDQSFCIRIDSFSKAASCEEGIAFIDSLVASHSSLTLPVFHSILRFFLKFNDARLVSWFQRLQQRVSQSREGAPGFTYPAADSTCYAIAMAYALHEEDFDEVLRLYQELRCSHTLEPDSTIYEMLFEMYFRKRDSRSSVALFDTIRVNRVSLETSCYNSILKIFVEHDDPYVYDVLSYMKEHRCAPLESTMAVFLCDAKGRRILNEIVSRALFYKPLKRLYIAKLNLLATEEEK